jgi:membrane protein DedA with SNARE-associated domain
MFDIQTWITWLKGAYDTYGYLIVFFGAMGENTAFLGAILPGGTLALLGAFYAKQGTLNLGWVIFFATLGTVLGYHIDYLIGRFALAGMLAKWGKSRWGRRLRIDARLRLARRMLKKRGGPAILISHVAGHLRSFVALSAGITHMRYRSFLLWELLAAFLWNTAYSLLGYFIAVELDQLRRIIEQAGLAIFAACIVLLSIWWLWKQKKQRVRRGRRKLSSASSRQ